MTLVLQFIPIIILSFILVKAVIKFAHQLDLYDVPNERSHHCNVTPSGAGIGFILAFFTSVAVFEFQLFLQNWYIFLAIALVFGVGIVDDRFEVRARLKFIIIFVAVFVMWLGGLSIGTLGLWFGYEITMYAWIALPFTMFAVAGFTNALNLIDGIDGLSTSISIVILIFFGLIGFEFKDSLMMIISSFAIASLVGFLLLNWNPAKIFMGDSGSLTLGFIISVLAILSLEYIHPIAILYLTAMPILDTLIVMIRRIRRGKSPFSPDKTHIHHILVKFFDNNVPKTVGFLVILQIVFSAIGYMILDIINKGGGMGVPFFALVGFTMMFLMFYMIFTGIKKRQLALDLQK